MDLLNADIADIIRATKLNNPDALIFGIEESSGQKKTRRRSLEGSRDQSIYENIVEHYVPGQRTAALLGALHCNHRWNWLYTKLEKPGSPLESANLLNLRLLSDRKDFTLTRAYALHFFVGLCGRRLCPGGYPNPGPFGARLVSGPHQKPYKISISCSISVRTLMKFEPGLCGFRHLTIWFRVAPSVERQIPNHP